MLAGLQALPPRQQAVIDGRKLSYVLAGSGGPAIVLLNGSGGPVEGWWRIFGGLREIDAAVFAYDRPGIGGSDKPTQPQAGEAVLADLRALLAHAGLRPPWLLVGHSLGGLFANLHARRFPQEVAGVVMLDATAPQDPALVQAHLTAVQKLWMRISGRLFAHDALHETAQAGHTVRQLAEAGPFPDVPLAVVTGGRPVPSWQMPLAVREGRREHQRLLAGLSPRGRQVLAEGSRHFPQFSEPQLVLRVVRETWLQARDAPAAVVRQVG